MSAKHTHTPGPWQVGGGFDRSVVTDDGATVCQRVYSPQDGALIAAAPDLLAILERIVYAHENHGNGAAMGEAVLCQMYANIARAAIAKAKGE